MKNITLLIVTLMLNQFAFNQILPGTMDVSGMPNFTQNISDAIAEAGMDDKSTGFETNTDATLLTFTLNPSTFRSSEENCSNNVYRYKVFIHRSYNPSYEKTDILARTFTNSGNRYPEAILYDALISQPLGPRNLTPENGNQYISVPDDQSKAIKIMEFIGCRRDIQIQFRILPSVLSPSGVGNMEIFYTIVGSTI